MAVLLPLSTETAFIKAKLHVQSEPLYLYAHLPYIKLTHLRLALACHHVVICTATWLQTLPKPSYSARIKLRNHTDTYTEEIK
jgi:hypothetical protein